MGYGVEEDDADGEVSSQLRLQSEQQAEEERKKEEERHREALLKKDS